MTRKDISRKIQLTPTQIEAYENGATCFMFSIDKDKLERIEKYCRYEYIFQEQIIKQLSPIQKGDKDIYVQEEQEYFLDDDEIALMGCAYSGETSTTELVTVGNFKECIDVKVVRVQDCIYDNSDILPSIDIGAIKKLGVEYRVPRSYSGHIENAKDGFINFYNNQLKEQNINRTYNDNDYVFLVELRR